MRLVEAEILAAKPGFRDRLGPTREYLHASRQRETTGSRPEKQREQAELRAAQQHAAALRKRSRILLGVVVAAAVIAVVLTVIVLYGLGLLNIRMTSLGELVSGGVVTPAAPTRAVQPVGWPGAHICVVARAQTR